MRHHLQRVLTSPVFIAGFAFALRIFLLDYSWRNGPIPVRDNLPFGYELGKVARSIAAGNGFSSPLRFVESGPSVWFTPIYPYLVAGIFKIWGIYSDISRMIIQTLNCAFGALTIIPIHAMARKSFGKGVASGAAWGWAIFPTALFFPIFWIWDTAMAALFFALILWATLEMEETRSLAAWAGYGALWVTGVLVNPSLLAVFPFLLGWLAWQARRNSAQWMKLSAATLALFLIGLTPWTVRNYVVFHKLIVLRSNFGLELWLGNNPEVGGDTSSAWMHPNDNQEEARKYQQMGEITYMEQKEREAVQFMRTHPADTMFHMFHRFVETWLGVTDSPADVWTNAPLYGKAFVALNSSFSLLCLLGALFAYRSGNRDAIPYALVLLIFPLVFYATHSSLRYRFPMDPIMMVLAAAGAGHLLFLLRTWWTRVRGAAEPVHSLEAR